MFFIHYFASLTFYIIIFLHTFFFIYNILYLEFHIDIFFSYNLNFNTLNLLTLFVIFVSLYLSYCPVLTFFLVNSNFNFNQCCSISSLYLRFFCWTFSLVFSFSFLYLMIYPSFSYQPAQIHSKAILEHFWWIFSREFAF